MLRTFIHCTTDFFYSFLFEPIESYITVEWFVAVFIAIATPSLILIHAGRYTLSSFYGGRRNRLTHNLRIRRLTAYYRSGGRGIIHSTLSHSYYSQDLLCDSRSSCGFKREFCQPYGKSATRERARSTSRNKRETLTENEGAPSCNKRDTLTFGEGALPSTVYQPSSVTIASFLSTFDVLTHHRIIQQHSTVTIPSHYTVLSSTSPVYLRILLEARGLQTTLQQYDEDLPLELPVIYVSSKPNELPIVIDTGASCSITPLLCDFINEPGVPDTKSMGGLTGTTTEVLGLGKINWDIEDVNGIRCPLITSAYFVPEATIRLFSPQVYIAEQYKENNVECTMTLDPFGLSLTLACGTTLKFPIQKGSNLPMMLTHKALHPINSKSKLKRHKRTKDRFTNLVNFLCSTTFDYINQKAAFNFSDAISIPSKIDDSESVLRRSNWNLNDDQRELLLWHDRLGHIHLKHVQALLAKPKDGERSEHKHRIIQPSNNKCSHCECQNCLCEACQYAKQKRRKPNSSKIVALKENEGALSVDIVHSGQRVSVDLYVSAVRGRLPESYGKEKTDKQYTGGAIFVDHKSRLVHHTHQFSTTAAETVNSKHNFERFCNSHGVKIKEYVADNNPFHSVDWKDDCKNQLQEFHYSGVGAHHQNYAERYIQTIFTMARALLLHFAIHWPQKADAQLWPFAVDHAVYLWNKMPKIDTKLSPLEVFTDTLFHNHHHLQRLHVFGCPVYVLDPKLQDAKKLPKWERRSRRGIYLGVSKHHSSTVHLVLNTDTGKVTPQYHVVFDDSFSTVYSDGKFNDDVWNSLVTSNLDRHPDTKFAVDIVPFQDSSSLEREISETTATNNDSPLQDPSSITDSANDEKPTSPSFDPTSTLSSAEGDPSSSEGASSPIEGASSSIEGVTLTENEGAPPLRRSTRRRNPVDRLQFHNNNKTNNNTADTQLLASMFDQAPRPSGSTQTTFNGTDRPSKLSAERVNQQYLSSLNWNSLLDTCSSSYSSLGAFIAEHQQNLSYDNLVEYLNPALLITLANKEDNPTFKEAMISPEAAGFVSAMETEILTLIELDVFDIVPRPQQKVISGVWALKRKRYPDGSIRKLKARYCARGFEQQKGIDYFETFAPVVMWLTVRLLLIMSILMDLDTKQIDYTAAFVHAPIDCLVFVEMPKGFVLPGMVWKLRKSLYGLSQSPRNFFLYTKGKLEKLGFTQSDADPCLFISRDVICLIYVDDALLFYKDAAAVDRLTRAMENDDMLFREEATVAGFLGVHIDRKDDGSIHLTQSGLAKTIVEALHLNDSSISSVETPCTGFLPIDKHGEEAHGEFSYPSVVGQLNYLQGHSRCDIGMATSQVAHYVHHPKRSHELALIQIGRYLKGTLDNGLILKPSHDSSSFQMDVYVDAAFACGWGSEEGTNPDSVKSRTGYIIEIANCPVLWVSKLQSTIATSTMESEYTALSMALRAAIPLLAVVSSVTKGLNYLKHQQLTFKATVHEDNQGALILANLEPGRHTVRSKFYALRLHWFRSWIIPNNIKVQFIGTLDQKADFLTKALSPRVFKANRKLSMGW